MIEKDQRLVEPLGQAKRRELLLQGFLGLLDGLGGSDDALDDQRCSLLVDDDLALAGHELLEDP